MIKEFFAKYNWRAINFDGRFGAQCVDLYRQYVKEVLGFPQSPPVKGAYEIWNTYDPKYYEKILNTPLAIPKEGDILIWDRRVGGGHGHVAIYSSGNLFSFTSFDQNWPVGTYCHFQKHNYYGGLVGWLRPRTQSAPPAGDDVKLNEIKSIVDSNGTPKEKIEKIKKIVL